MSNTSELPPSLPLEAKTPVSPKVPAATLSGALGLVVTYLVGEIPWVDSWPAPVQAALQVLIVAALIYAGGYLRGDLLRAIGQQALANEIDNGLKIQNGE